VAVSAQGRWLIAGLAAGVVGAEVGAGFCGLGQFSLQSTRRRLPRPWPTFSGHERSRQAGRGVAVAGAVLKESGKPM